MIYREKYRNWRSKLRKRNKKVSNKSINSNNKKLNKKLRWKLCRMSWYKHRVRCHWRRIRHSCIKIRLSSSHSRWCRWGRTWPKPTVMFIRLIVNKICRSERYRCSRTRCCKRICLYSSTRRLTSNFWVSLFLNWVNMFPNWVSSRVSARRHSSSRLSLLGRAPRMPELPKCKAQEQDRLCPGEEEVSRRWIPSEIHILEKHKTTRTTLTGWISILILRGLIGVQMGMGHLKRVSGRDKKRRSGTRREGVRRRRRRGYSGLRRELLQRRLKASSGQIVPPLKKRVSTGAPLPELKNRLWLKLRSNWPVTVSKKLRKEMLKNNNNSRTLRIIWCSSILTEINTKGSLTRYLKMPRPWPRKDAVNF